MVAICCPDAVSHRGYDATHMSSGPSLKTLKILFALSGNRCAAPGCENPIVAAATPFDEAAVIGHIAHIVARSSDGPRGVREFPQAQLHDESNLILLCGHHHSLVDAQNATFTVDELRSWKVLHRQALEPVSSSLGTGSYVSPDLVEDQYLDTEIVILLRGTNLFDAPVYSYLRLVGRDLKRMFGDMEAGRNFKPSDYGTVLLAGQDMPSPEITAFMNETYDLVDVDAPLAPRSVTAPIGKQS